MASDASEQNVTKEQQVIDDDEDTDIEDSTSETQAEVYRWEIEDFPAMQQELLQDNRFGSKLSEVFIIGGCKWQLLLFPHGNGDGRGQHLSLYLQVADKDVLPEGWRREARFWLYIVNSKDEKLTVRQQTSTVASDDWEDNWKAPEPFSAKKHDWGFPKMIPLQKLNTEGFLRDGKTLVIQAEITVFRAWIDYRSLRTQRLKSREETGHVGIYNQAATCYLNAWLQALFHTGAFRRAVYQIPTGSADVNKSIPLALQRLFYRLQFHEDSVESVELTTAFGWTAADVSQQHDVHELNCKLLDNLEKKMKNTPADGSIERLFRGEIINFIECVNVNYKSEVPEAIYDFGLVVKGCRDIYESFDKYVSVEMLDGDNQYRAEGFGLQDARKGLRISKLPPVLMLQLQRWELDMVRFVTYKVNDKYIFHPVLDLGRYLPEGYTESGIYHLHAILVHTGGAGAGHYYAYVRPNTKSDWLLFDDSRVAKATEKQAIEDNWGGFEEHSWRRFGETIKWTHPRSSNAYMLLYIRETEAHQFMGFETGEDVIPEHIHKVGEEHLFMDMLIAQSKHLAKHDQNKFDLITRKSVAPPVKVRRQASVREAMATTLAEATGVPAENQRLWLFRERENKTLRLHRPLNDDELELPFESFVSSRRREQAHKMLYLEDNRETGAILPAPADSSPLLYFFKYYEPSTQTVEYAGSHHFNTEEGDSIDIFRAVCNRLKGFPEDTPLSFWEEETPDIIRPLPLDLNFRHQNTNLLPGDIIVFSKTAVPGEPSQEFALPDPPSWYMWKRHGVKIRFRKLETPGDETTEFSLELSKKMSHEEVAIRVAKHLGLDDHNKLRFTSLASHTDQPRHDPCRPSQNLKDMITYFYAGPTLDILFYEILPVTLAELEQLKQVTVALQNARCQVVKTVKVFVQKNGLVDDVIAAARDRADPDTFTLGTGKFRLMEVWTSKIHSILQPETPVLRATCQNLVLEECAPEEEGLQPGDQLARVSHFELSAFQNPSYHGNPFHFVVKAGETCASVKQRLQARLGIADEDFAKWRLVVIGYSNCKRIADDQDISAFDLGSQNQYSQLGLEHPDDSYDLAGWNTIVHHEERVLKFGDDD